jgi:hypothetical protein
MTVDWQRLFRRNRNVKRALWLALSAAALYALDRAFLRAPCWSLFFLCAVVAWPIWHHHREYALFRRRVVLAGLFVTGSRVRRWFWPGHMSGVGQVVSALVWATLLLAVGATLTPQRWAVLAADVLALALVIGPIRRRLVVEVREGRAGLVARRWPLAAVNVAVLTLSFLVLDFFVTGAPDTRGMTWNVVAERAFAEVDAGASCRLAGWLAGVPVVADRLAWHAFEVLTPSLPYPELRLAAWLSFLLQASLFSYAFTSFLLGVVALVERPTPRLARLFGGDRLSKAFVLTLLVLALPYLYAVIRLRDYEPAAFAGLARRIVAVANPCCLDPKGAAALKAGLAAEIDGVRAASKERAAERIDGELRTLYGDVEHGVDDYLDWYFSVLGEYQRLAALAGGGFAERMRRELEQRLFPGDGFDAQLARANRQIADGSSAQMSALATRLGVELRSELRTHPCQLEIARPSARAHLDRDLQRAATAAGAGAVVGAAATTLLVRKTATAVAGKLAAKKAFQVAETLPAKMAAKRGGSILLSAAGATALCAPAGPLAALCGVGAGVATWLIVDQALVKIDEIRFRAEMRREILEAALGQKAELAQALRAMHDAAIDEMAQGLQQAVDGAFIPVRDGL